MKQKNSTRSQKKQKIVLGRGLDALIPDIESIENNQEDYFQCDIELIHSNPYQPRIHFSEDAMAELTRSIKTQGILQPLLVRKYDTGYQLVAGERRLRAAKKAGIRQVPVIIKNVNDEELLEMSIVENIQRAELNPLEEAEAYNQLITEFKLTQDQAADRVGKSRSTVANLLRLRQLPQPIKSSIMEGTLSMGHARALLGVETTAHQNAAWRAVVSKGLSVRQTEALVKRLKEEKKRLKKGPESSEDFFLSGIVDDLSRQFGTRVQIKRRGQKGKVEIEFYSDEDLNRLIDLLHKIS